MNYTITKDNFIKQILIWQKEYNIFSCKKGKDGFIWEEVDIKNFSMQPLISIIPPTKKFFLPNNEILFNFVFNKIIIKENIKPLILLGLSGLDLKAISLLDKVLANDHYYQTNRQRSITIGVGSQISDEKCDIFIQNLIDSYQIIINSDKAQKIISKNLYHKNPDTFCSKIKITDPLFSNQEKLVKAIKASINDKIWDELAETCLGCGICSYVCPLCYCFSLEDQIDLDNKICSKDCQFCSGSRVRKWDSCMLPHFSQVA
ncbi:MAG: hydrogenase, partial [uncultured bacterium]